MTTKTPAEIAESTVPFDGGKPTDRTPLRWAEVQALIVEAIEADRAQRGIDTDGLRAALKDYDDSLIENTDDGTVWEIRDGSTLADWARKTLGPEV